MSPLLIDATDLEFWAKRRTGQDTLPRLMRKLIYATVDDVHLDGFAAGEAVQLGGWDGIVQVEKGNAFVPDGVSVWELGTNEDITRKANRDYRKRTKNPLGVDQAQATYIAVSPRRWKDKTGWESARRKEHKWRDVRFYDADKLETWLEEASVVHIWISIILGKHPAGAIDLASFWQNWASTTKPKTSPELVLAGRTSIQESVHGWFESPTPTLALRGESRDEALAVFAAAAKTFSPEKRERLFSRVAIVNDIASWNRLAVSDEHLILVQNFESTSTIGGAIRHGHAGVVLLGRADSVSTGALEIPRLSRAEALDALVAMGIPETQAGVAVNSGRRSLTSLRRKIAARPEIEQPKWARPDTGPSLLPALLAGRWSDQTQGDRDVIAALAGKSYDDVKNGFVRWLNEDDPPLRCVGAVWYLSSEVDAWALLVRYLTQDDLERFEQVALQVLGTTHPSFELPEDKRWMSGVLGRRPLHSHHLHTGLATTLAIMGADDSIRIAGGLSIQPFAARCVQQLLATNDWQAWAFLPLPLLAEAAPDQFLSAVERTLSGDSPPLRSLFTDTDDSLFSSSPHTGLLWALETLAWSKDHIGRASLLLAKLAMVDPGGKLANRPLRSLRSIFLTWLPQTAAPLDQRLDVLDNLREQVPDVAWKLMRALLPQALSDSSIPTAKPRWQTWAGHADLKAPGAEFAKAVQELVNRMLKDVGQCGERWCVLIESLDALPAAELDEVVRSLGTLEPSQLPAPDCASVWNALHALISRHRSHPSAAWSLPRERVDQLAEFLERFEPQDPVARFGWLFGRRPELPDGRQGDWKAYEEAVTAKQTDAARALSHDAGYSWVPEFVQKVERPDRVGAALADSGYAPEDIADLFGKYLAPEYHPGIKFISGFVNWHVRSRGLDWAKSLLRSSVSEDWSVEQKGLFCACLPAESDTWDMVEDLGDDTVRCYWAVVRPPCVEEHETERAVRRLLDHRRPGVAVDLLSLRVDSKVIPVALVADALEQFLRAPRDDPDGAPVSAYQISELLALVAQSCEVGPIRVASLEWGFLPVLSPSDYQPRLLHGKLARSPDFFAEVVSYAFRAKDEDRRKLSEEDTMRATRAYELLDSWQTLPGTTDDGSLDPEALREWVKKARKLLQDTDRLAIGDISIGQVLAAGPGGEDGAWPRPGIREVIEESASDDLERGIVMGLVNREGVTTRKPNEGGERERNAAEGYQRHAVIVSARWGRTAALLRRISDDFLARAQAEDQRAELREDLSD